MNSCQKYFSACLLALFTQALSAQPPPPPPPPGVADFTVLAGSAVTCTDGDITGDVGTAQAAPTGAVTLRKDPRGPFSFCMSGSAHCAWRPGTKQGGLCTAANSRTRAKMP